MKKILLSLAALASLSFIAESQSAFAQGEKAGGAGAPAAQASAKIGLVDMGKVFKKYEKFARLREDLQGQMTQMQNEAKGVKAQVEKLSEELKGYNKDSKEYRALQEKIVRITTEYEAKMKLAGPEMARKEAQIFEDVYLEVTDVVKKYAEFYNYTLVIRFNSDQIDADSPQQLAQGLNKLVLYHRPENDITQPVIDFLNKQFVKNGGVAGGGAGAGAGAAKPTQPAPNRTATGGSGNPRN